ncbi:unnamed protein product [Caenorhabditis angaria]|uniref:Uncharacterized protein n=1 Tax=Caenorhabditis angaria TaxID=860376 RepID=A0A9P1ISR8_9PELO|nr:unnamed protein product [Caenorhabditis angaria]
MPFEKFTECNRTIWAPKNAIIKSELIKKYPESSVIFTNGVFFENHQEEEILKTGVGNIFGLRFVEQLQLYRCDLTGKDLNVEIVEIDTFVHLESGAQITKGTTTQFIDNNFLFLESFQKKNQYFFNDLVHLDEGSLEKEVPMENLELENTFETLKSTSNSPARDSLSDDLVLMDFETEKSASDNEHQLSEFNAIRTSASTVSTTSTLPGSFALKNDEEATKSKMSKNLKRSQVSNQKNISKKQKKNENTEQETSFDSDNSLDDSNPSPNSSGNIRKKLGVQINVVKKQKKPRRKQVDKTFGEKLRFEEAKKTMNIMCHLKIRANSTEMVDVDKIEFSAVLREDVTDEVENNVFGYKNDHTGKYIILSGQTKIEQLCVKNGKTSVTIFNVDEANANLVAIIRSMTVREFSTAEKMNHVRFIFASANFRFDWLRKLTCNKLKDLFFMFNREFYPPWLIRISVLDENVFSILKSVMRKFSKNGVTLARKIPGIYETNRSKLLEVLLNFDANPTSRITDLVDEIRNLELTKFCRNVKGAKTYDGIVEEYESFKNSGFGIRFCDDIEPSEVGFLNGMDLGGLDDWISYEQQCQILFLVNDESEVCSLKKFVLLKEPVIINQTTMKLLPISIRVYENGEIVDDEDQITEIILRKSKISTDLFELKEFVELIPKFGRTCVINECELGMNILRKIDIGEAHSSNKIFNKLGNFIK